MPLRAWEVLELLEMRIFNKQIFSYFAIIIWFWLLWRILYWAEPKFTLNKSLSEDLVTERAEHPQFFIILLPGTLNKIRPLALQQQGHFSYLLRKDSSSQWKFWFAIYTFSKATFDMYVLHLQWAGKVLLISEENFNHSWMLLQIPPLMVILVDSMICLGSQM